MFTPGRRGRPAQGSTGMTSRIGNLVGTLATTSIDRTLASALIRPTRTTSTLRAPSASED